LIERRARARISFAATTAATIVPPLDQPRISGPAEKLCSTAPRWCRRRIKIVRLFGDQRLRREN
jgi:hypothetical protein